VTLNAASCPVKDTCRHVAACSPQLEGYEIFPRGAGRKPSSIQQPARYDKDPSRWVTQQTQNTTLTKTQMYFVGWGSSNARCSRLTFRNGLPGAGRPNGKKFCAAVRGTGQKIKYLNPTNNAASAETDLKRAVDFVRKCT
jgi:hypothetical protein